MANEEKPARKPGVHHAAEAPDSASGLPVQEWAPLVPELTVSDLQQSLSFWCGLLGFIIPFQRSDEGFAYLQRERAQVMLEQANATSWHVGTLERPLGRGINLQIEVTEVAPIVDRLASAGWRLYRPTEERWYTTGDVENGQRQFLVQDPDGYLLRFAQGLGSRPRVG